MRKVVKGLLAGLTLLLVACASATSGKDFDHNAVRQLSRGMETSEVVELLGEPSVKQTRRNSEIWIWSFATTEEVKTISVEFRGGKLIAANYLAEQGIKRKRVKKPEEGEEP